MTATASSSLDRRLSDAYDHHRAGDVDAAERAYRAVLEIDPLHPRANHMLGVTLAMKQRTDEALPFLEQAARAAPSTAVYHSNLGEAYRALNRRHDAIGAYQRALTLDPGIGAIKGPFGRLLMESDRVDDGIAYMQQALEDNPQDVETLIALSVAYERRGQRGKAFTLLKRAETLSPDAPYIRKHLQRLYHRLIPLWHFPMMNDGQRNDAFDRAIRAAVQPGDIVLEIGTGAGLLAMMAARAGAGHVYTCETVLPLAEKAREIVALNGLADRVTVIDRRSSKIAVGKELPVRADVLVGEIVDVGLLGEGILPSFEDARERLVKPEGRIIPRAATVYFTLHDAPGLARQNSIGRVAGFDLSPFNEFAFPSYAQQRVRDYDAVDLSAVEVAFRFDFAGAPVESRERKIVVEAIADGEVNCIAAWFRLHLDAEATIDTGPDRESHWKQAIHIQRTPFRVRKGDYVTVAARHSRNMINFDLEPTATRPA